jgi:pimeloyl-ACP methyl ester carboxylesterase
MMKTPAALLALRKPFADAFERWRTARERALPRRRVPVKITLLRVALSMVVVFCVLAIWGYGYAVVYHQADRTVEDLSRRWAQPPSRFVDVDGMQVHVREMGPVSDPNPIVLIHDDNSSLYTWSAWMQGLSATRRVIAMDLPGYGLTGPSPERAYGLLNEAGFISRLMQALGVSRCQLVGNGWGGELAQMVAVVDPGLVTKLVLIAPAGYATNTPPDRFLYDWFRGLVFDPLYLETLSRAKVARDLKLRYAHPERVTDDLVERDFELRLRSGNRQAQLDIHDRKENKPTADQLANIRVPVLIVWGGRDAIQPQEQAYWQQRDMPGAQVVILDDLGHFPQEEDPPASLQAVMPFLSQP